MKKIICALLFLPLITNAQVKLNTQTNQNILLDMRQDVNATSVNKKDKGFVLPRNVLSDKLSKSNVNTTTSQTLESGLLIYNTKTDKTSSVQSKNVEEGPHFWYNKDANLGAWTPFVSSKNENKLLNLNYIKTYNLGSVTLTKSQTNNNDGTWSNDIGDKITDNGWVELPGTTAQFVINNTKNIITLATSGYIEAYRNTAGTPSVSFDIGIFINGELKVYSPFSFTKVGTNVINCMYTPYTLTGIIKNLPINTTANPNYTVKVAVKNRNIIGGDGNNAVQVTYNSRNTNCENKNLLPNVGASSALLNVQIQENPSILND